MKVGKAENKDVFVYQNVTSFTAFFNLRKICPSEFSILSDLSSEAARVHLFEMMRYGLLLNRKTDLSFKDWQKFSTASAYPYYMFGLFASEQGASKLPALPSGLDESAWKRKGVFTVQLTVPITTLPNVTFVSMACQKMVYSINMTTFEVVGKRIYYD